MQMGLREANQQFARAIRAVKAGREVVLTERGRPIAVIKPVAQEASLEAGIRRLEASGLLEAAEVRGPLPPWRPRRLRGEPLSRTVSADRDLD